MYFTEIESQTFFHYSISSNLIFPLLGSKLNYIKIENSISFHNAHNLNLITYCSAFIKGYVNEERLIHMSEASYV